jgi:ribosomal protein L3 glutamine methyltransferase
MAGLYCDASISREVCGPQPQGETDFLKISAWISYAEQRFQQAGLHFGHGTDNAADEAVWLVLHVAGAPLDGSFADWQRNLDASEGKQVDALVQARIESRKPLAYLLGKAWFAGLEFEVNEDVLVPRSPIAELVQEQFSPWLNPESSPSVLDLCTGSGCIAIATAFYLPGARVDATDISTSALRIAYRNVLRHDMQDHVRLVHSDLFAALGDKRYDLIVTNPPYVAETAASLPAEYQAEPALGLYSGPDGLDLCLRIMVQSAHHLEEAGILICEVGESAPRLAAALPHVPFLWLEFMSGGEGVFLLGRDVLIQAAGEVDSLIKERSRVG